MDNEHPFAKSTGRVAHASQMLVEWNRILVEDRDISARFPGAIDDLYARFIEGPVADAADEDADMCLLFHQTNKFDVTEEGQLYVEFPYATVRWDAAQRAWVGDGGEPYFADEG